MNLLIIGYRCSGKTTLGKALSNKHTVVDIDQIIMDKTQKTLPEITNYGKNLEPFRILETEVLEYFLENYEDKIVVASGGTGVNGYKDFGQRQFEIIKNSENTKVAWINTPIELIIERLLEDFQNPNSHRPELTTSTSANSQVSNNMDRYLAKLKTEIQIYESRIPNYDSLADYTLVENDLDKLVILIEDIIRDIKQQS
jgi:shikimate kinase